MKSTAGKSIAAPTTGPKGTHVHPVPGLAPSAPPRGGIEEPHPAVLDDEVEGVSHPRSGHVRREPREGGPPREAPAELTVEKPVRSEVLDVVDPERRAKRSGGSTVRRAEVLRAKTDRHAPVLDQVHGRGAEKRGDESVRRVVVDLRRRPGLTDPPLVHDDDAVAERHRFDLIVRYVDGRRPDASLELLQLFARGCAQLRVEVRQRLVEKKELGLPDERAGERDALSLPARELPGAPVEQGFDAEDRRRPGHLGGVCSGDALGIQRKRCCGNGQVRIER